MEAISRLCFLLTSPSLTLTFFAIDNSSAKQQGKMKDARKLQKVQVPSEYVLMSYFFKHVSWDLENSSESEFPLLFEKRS